MKRKPRIIYYPDSKHSACSFWRATGPLLELSRQDKIVLHEGTWNDSWTTLREYDIAFFQRPMSINCRQQILTAKDLGLKVIIDLDDFNAIPDHHPVYDEYRNMYDERNFKQIMLLADKVFTTNEYLRSHYSKYSKNVVIIPNAINDHWLQLQPVKDGKYIFLRGGDHHHEDFYHYKDELIRVLNGNRWGLIVAGSNPLFLKNEIKDYTYVGDFNIHKYFAYLINTPSSIFAVPLINSEFNQAKSNISWIESTLAGAVALTPYWFYLNDPTDKAVEYDGKQSFADGLNELITNQKLRRELHWNSFKNIHENYLLSKVNEKRLELFNELI